jgi:chitin disaccharide deacetylase
MPVLPRSAAALQGGSSPNRPAPVGDPTGSNAAAQGLLILNADDWGGWERATDAILACFEKGRVNSASAMVFMADSERGARLAKDRGLDVGLHVNLNQDFSGRNCPASVRKSQDRIRRFLGCSRYAQLVYNPFLRREFRNVFQAQFEEFAQLYGRPPSHIDGHRHMHLCANMLWDGIIPAGQKVRRSFSFWPGEKSPLNRAYRNWVHKRLTRRFRTTDYFFALSQCLHGERLARVADLAKATNVELMTHPEQPEEYAFLQGEDYLTFTRNLRSGPYTML